MRISDLNWEYSDDLYREKLLELSYFVFKYDGDDRYTPLVARPSIGEATNFINKEMSKYRDPSEIPDFVIVKAYNISGAKEEVKNKRFLTSKN
jgi:hypothetical protein